MMGGRGYDGSIHEAVLRKVKGSRKGLAGSHLPRVGIADLSTDTHTIFITQCDPAVLRNSPSPLSPLHNHPRTWGGGSGKVKNHLC